MHWNELFELNELFFCGNYGNEIFSLPSSEYISKKRMKFIPRNTGPVCIIKMT